MKCFNCGNDLPDSAKFCDKCGARMNTAAPVSNAPAPAAAPTAPTRVAAPVAPSAPVSAAPTSTAPTRTAAPAVQPQPISEQNIMPDTAQAPAEKPKAANTKRNIIILLVVLVLLIAGTAAAVLAVGSNGTQSAADLISTAEKYLSEANYEQAIIEFDKAISIDPMNPSAYIGKANAYISAGDIEKAIETLQEGYAKTGNADIKAKLDELTASNVSSDGTTVQRAPSFSYGDPRCIEIEPMPLGCINGGAADSAMLAEVTELYLYGDSCISVICGNKGGTDITGNAGCAISGSVKDISFAQYLVNASRIEIVGNPISDLSPLSSLSALRRLSLFGSYTISNITPLSSLTELTLLDLGMADISDISALASLTKLTSLDLNGNSISDISPLSQLTELSYLDLGGNKLNAISSLSGLTKLKHLNVSINSISDISVVSGMTELEELYLWDNNIKDIAAISGLKKLNRLYLEYNKITDVSALTGLSQLRWLYLIGNDVNESSLSSLKQSLTNCSIM